MNVSITFWIRHVFFCFSSSADDRCCERSETSRLFLISVASCTCSVTTGEWGCNGEFLLNIFLLLFHAQHWLNSLWNNLFFCVWKGVKISYLATGSCFIFIVRMRKWSQSPHPTLNKEASQHLEGPAGRFVAFGQSQARCFHLFPKFMSC